MRDATTDWQRAVELNRQGEPAQAKGILEGVLDDLDRLGEAAPDGELLRLRCNVLITLALAELLVHGLRRATACLDEAEAVAHRLGDRLLTARVAFQRASIAGRVGDLSMAWENMQEALRVPEAFTGRERVAILLNSGMLAFETANAREAVDAFRRAAREASAGGFTVQERMARHNEGYATFLLGDVPRALHLMAEAAAIAPDHWFGAEVLDRARVLLEAGLVGDALDVLEAASHRSGEQSRQQVADFHFEAARAMRLQGRWEAAEVAAVRARRGYEEVGAAAWANRARLVELQVALDRLRRPADPSAVVKVGPAEVAAQALAVAAQAAAKSDAETIRAACLLRSDALLAAGDVDAAASELAACRGSRHSLTSELAHVAVEAEIMAAQGRRAPARRLLTRAARSLAVAQGGSASIDVRTARAIHGVRLAGADLELAVGSGSNAVLMSLERWRAASDRLPRLDRAPDPELARLTEQLRATELQLRLAEDGDTTALEAGAVSLQQRIRARDWSTPGAPGGGEALGRRVARARQTLHERGRDLVWFFTRGPRLMGLGIIGGRARILDLMPRSEAMEIARRLRIDLRSAATRELGPFATAVQGALRASAATLDERLLRPWGARAEGLVLVSCEEVSALPWALFPSVSGRPVTVSASLTSYAQRVRRGRTGGPLGVEVSVGPSLARAAQEAEAVARSWRQVGASVCVRGASTAADAITAMASPGVVHVAAHGRHQTQSPLFSSLEFRDGPMFAHELQTKGVAAEHVVLSACEVGSATFRPGEEQLGLAAAVLSLGASTVVAATAPVPDDVAATVMERHHAHLAAGADSDAALAHAQRDVGPVGAAFIHLGGQFRR